MADDTGGQWVRVYGIGPADGPVYILERPADSAEPSQAQFERWRGNLESWAASGIDPTLDPRFARVLPAGWRIRSQPR